MKFIKSDIEGIWLIIPEPILDARGFFMRAYDRLIFEKTNLHRDWIQENHSCSKQKGIIRGLHLQMHPFSETKLVRCIRGAILDVFVDLRLNSKTFGKWDSFELSEENKKMVCIPKGFAHGFCTLSDYCEVLYKVDSVYKPDYEVGLLWNDTDLKIDWKIENPVLSEKDKNNISLEEFIEKFKGVEV